MSTAHRADEAARRRAPPTGCSNHDRPTSRRTEQQLNKMQMSASQQVADAATQHPTQRRHAGMEVPVDMSNIPSVQTAVSSFNPGDEPRRVLVILTTEECE